MGPDLTSALGTYVAQRAKEHSTALDAALFLTRTSTPVVRNTAEHIFSRLRVRAGVLRHDGGRFQPRLHDLRHHADFPVMPTRFWTAPDFPRLARSSEFCRTVEFG